jgi:hypothetical protein
LIPVTGGVDRDQARAALERIGRRAREMHSADLSWETLKADRDAGRP